MENKDIASAKRTIDKEVEALRMMEGELDDTLSKALDVMQNAKGRVIITGMGKSGHIGSKIAATLASTGTPSFFVHPGEASHGDLGMLTTDDVVVAISNSGETRELSDIILYCKRYGIPLISITKNRRHSLKAARRRRSLPARTGPHVLYNRNTGSGRYSGSLSVGTQRLFQNRFSSAPPRRQAWIIPSESFRPDAQRRRNAAG